MGHLWFLPTLFAIMMVCFFLLPKQRNFWLDCFVMVLFIVLVKLPNFISLPVPYYVTFCANAFGFVLGYMMHKYSSVIESRKTVFVSLSILTGAFILMSCHVPLSKVIAASALVVIAFCGMPAIDTPIVRAISKNSFGLYLFHSPLIYFAFMLCPDIHPLVMLIVNFVGCGFIAFMLTELVRKAHLGWIIGEVNKKI